MTYDNWKATNPDDEWLGPEPEPEPEPIKPGDRVQMHSASGRSVWTGIVIPGGRHGMVRVLWDDANWTGEIEPELVEVIEP